MAWLTLAIALAGCGESDDTSGNTGGFPGTGGVTSGGSAGSMSGSGGSGVGTGGFASGGGGGVSGAGESGGFLGTSGGAPPGSGGSGGAGTGGVPGTGGSATTGGASGTGGALGSASMEDDGADCTIANLPDAASLPAVSKLPDPFKKLDGTRITSRSEWRCRREEIRKQAEKYAYGTKPPKPESVTGTVSSTSITVKVSDAGKNASFSAAVVLPGTGTPPYPVIFVYGGLGLGFGIPLDGSVIKSESVALVNYDVGVTGKDGTGRASKQGAFYDIAGKSSPSGLLIAWAWGVSRMIDVIEQSDGKVLKVSAVGVTGCSRFGKGAFIAGAFDQRVALTMPIESGTAGVPIWRGIPGEGAQSLGSAYGEQPWYGDAFSAFTASPTKAPIDTHETIAMIAPRGLFVMDNPSIANLGPKSAHVAALAGAEVYKALGAGDNVTYYSDVQNGTHCSMRPEWAAPLRSNIRKFLNKTESDAGVVKAAAKATGKLSDWVDWTTPALP